MHQDRVRTKNYMRDFTIIEILIVVVIIAIAAMIAIPMIGSAAVAQPWAGSGTPNDPYLIYDANDMQAIGADANYWDAHFKLMADIDLGGFTGTSFNIIGNSTTKFTGVFDGNGHTISNFTYDSNGVNYIGLFGYVEGPSAKIKNLGLFDPNVDAGTGSNVGSLVGTVVYGTITGCWVKGGRVSGNEYVGVDNSINRASKYLFFNSDGVPAVASSVVSPIVTPFMETVLDDSSALTAKVTLNVPFYSANDYDNFATAISTIGATKVTLLITESELVETDVTVPSTCTLMFLRDGMLDISSSKTVTINGQLYAELHQIFAGSGSVSFGNGGVTEIYPEWFGAVGDGSPPELTGTDDAPAFTKLISALPTNGIPIFLTKWYRIDSTLTIPDSIPFRMRGIHRGGHEHWKGCGLIYTATNGSDCLTTNDNDSSQRIVMLEDFGICGNDNSGRGIYLRYTHYGTFLKNIAVVRCGGNGIELYKSWDSTLQYCLIRENDGTGLKIGMGSNTQIIGCKVVDNDTSNLDISWEETGDTSGGIAISGGDYSQYAITGVDASSIRIGTVIGCTIEGIFIENTLSTYNNHFIYINGWAANSKAEGIVIQGNTIATTATSGTGYPIRIQKCDGALIQGNNIGHGSLSAPIQIHANTQNVVIGANKITADPDISTDPSCKQVSFTQHKLVQYSFNRDNVAQSDDVNPYIAGTTLDVVKFDKPAHLIGIYAKSNTAITTGSMTITAAGKTLALTLNSGAQEANTWQQSFIDEWAADESIQARIVASADLLPNGSLDVFVTLIIAIDNDE